MKQIRPHRENGELRIFVSSTFSDMRRERDVLARLVLPRVQSEGERRGIACYPIEFRWGITSRQVDAGLVLPICLREAFEADMFVGILGERYGWQPAEINRDLLEQYPWLDGLDRPSITELEFRQVLETEQWKGQAFFFELDCRASSPGIETPQAGRRLKLLKDDIRASVYPVAAYAEPEELRELVGNALLTTLDEKFPTPEAEDPWRHEDLAHRHFMRARPGRFYCGKGGWFRSLDRTRSRRRQPILVSGLPGCGKSAFLAAWLSDIHLDDERVVAHPAKRVLGELSSKMNQLFIKWPDFVFYHFVGASEKSGWLSALLQRLYHSLKNRFDLPGVVPDDPWEIRCSLYQWLEAASLKGRVLVVIDGIDQLRSQDTDLGPAWIPNRLPKGIHLIVSGADESLKQYAKRQRWCIWNLPPLSKSELRRLIHGYLRSYRRSMSESQIRKLEDRLATKTTGYLITVIEELLNVESHEDLDFEIDQLCIHEARSDLYRDILDRRFDALERHAIDTSGIVRACVSLACSRTGLSDRELNQLMGADDHALSNWAWVAFEAASRHLLIRRQGYLDWLNQDVADAVGDRFMATFQEKIAAHQHLYTFYLAQPESVHTMNERLWSALMAGNYQELAAELTSSHFILRHWSTHAAIYAQYLGMIREKIGSETDLYLQKLSETAEKMPDLGYPAAVLLTAAGRYQEANLLLHQTINQNARFPEGVSEAEVMVFQLGLKWRCEGTHAGIELLLEKARSKASNINLPVLSAYVYLIDAMLAEKHQPPEITIGRYREAVHFCRDHALYFQLAMALGNFADFMANGKKFNEVLKLRNEQEVLCRQICDHEGLVKAITQKAYIYSRIGKVSRSEDLFKDAAKEALRSYPSLYAYCMSGLIDQLIRRRQFRKADQTASQLLDWINHNEPGSIMGLVMVLLKRSSCYWRSDPDSVKATEFRDEAWRLAHQSGMSGAIQRITREDQKRLKYKQEWESVY